MPKCSYTPFNKSRLLFLIHNVQNLAVFLKIALIISLICTYNLMMDINSEVNNISDENTIQNLNEENNKFIEFPEPKVSKKEADSKRFFMEKPKEENNISIESFAPNVDKKETELKELMMTKKPKEADKQKNISSVCNRPMYQRKYFRPPAPLKRKPAPAVSIRMSNPQAEIVLQERQVEIKDLESQVVYLRNQIKELKAENKTLVDVQNRQTKELKRYCGGITDIPALIRSHNDEIKAIQSNANAVRKEFRVCQQDLKSKNELLLRKDQELDKLKYALKNSGKNVQEITTGNRRLIQESKRLDDETKRLLNENEDLKTETETMQKTVQHLTNKVLDLESSLSIIKHSKKQLKVDLEELQNKYDEVLKNEINFKKSLEVPKVMSTTQTDKVETVHVSMMTLEISKEPELLSSEKMSIGVQTSPDQIYLQCMPTELRESENLDNDIYEDKSLHSYPSKDQFTALDIYPDIFCDKESNRKPPSQARKPGFRKPMPCLPHEFPTEISDVKKFNRNSAPLSAFEVLKRPFGSVFDKKFVSSSNNLDQEPLGKSNILTSASLSLDFDGRKNTEDNLSFYCKEPTSKNYKRKSSIRTEPYLEFNITGKKDNDASCGNSFKSYNNSSHNDLFSNLTSKQNTMYPNG